MSTLIRTRRVSVTRYNPETLTYRDNIIANAGTISAASLIAADNFVTACKQANLWAKFLDVGLFMGDQLAAALVRIVTPAAAAFVNHGFVGGDYTERGVNGGLNGDGVAKYLATGAVDTTAGLAALAFYTRAAAPNGVTSAMVGTQTGAAVLACGLFHLSGPDMDAFLMGEASAVLAQNGKAGFYAGSSQNGNDQRLYFNGAQISAGNQNVQAPDGVEIFVFAENAQGNPARFWTGRGAFYAMMKSLTPGDVNALNGIVETLQIALNRNV